MVAVIASKSELAAFFLKAQSVLSSQRPLFASRSRADSLLKGLEVLESRMEEINRQVAKETGKSASLTQAEFNSAVSFARQMSYACHASTGNILRSSVDSKYVSVERVPLGIAVLISSYNTPLPNIFWKLAPSYLAGNTSLVCPSPYVAKSGAMIMEALYEGGVNPEVLAITDGSPSLSDAATGTGVANLVSFTGSNRVGRIISKRVADYHPKLVLELGGTNPLIVTESGQLGKAVFAAAVSAFSNGGQRCAAGSIALVQESIHDQFLENMAWQLSEGELVNVIRALNTPLISEDSRLTHHLHVEREMRLGAKVFAFETLAENNATAPVVISGFPHSFESCSHELFSPILRVVPFRDNSDAIEFSNRLPLRLTSAVWTERLSDMNLFKSKLQFGLVNFNGPTFGAEPNFPFGGMGLSGNGSRDAGFSALETYSQTMIWTVADE